MHQTVTLEQVLPDVLMYFGPPTLTDTWFPGYTWTIVSCRRCGSHLGWMFRLATLDDEEEPSEDEYDEEVGSLRTSSIHSSSSDDDVYEVDNNQDQLALENISNMSRENEGANESLFVSNVASEGDDNRVRIFWYAKYLFF